MNPPPSTISARARAACSVAATAAESWFGLDDGAVPALPVLPPRPVARPAAPSRWFAVGDPQTTPERLFTVLARAGLLGDDGFLQVDVGLVSMGDHFDFAGDLPDVERSGRAILAWLARHPPEHVVILAGNHDLCRVMELAHESDVSFAEARLRAAAIHAAGDAAADLLRAFAAEFPAIPTPGMARVDYSSFSERQRSMVQGLLLEGRLHLATTAPIGGVTALLTHAAVTRRELELLGLEADAAPPMIASALDMRLARAVAAAAPAWRRGERAAIDLRPLHVAGTTGREGGGLLYHRPACREREGSVDREWEFDPIAPRRFEPGSLPGGLLQAAGHSGHGRCVRELGPWVDAEAAALEHVSLRTLSAAPGGPRYVVGVAPALPHASLILVDPHLAHAPLETIELLQLG